MFRTRIVKGITVTLLAGLGAAAITESLPPASARGHQGTVALNPQPLPPGRHAPGSEGAALAAFTALQRLDPYKS